MPIFKSNFRLVAILDKDNRLHLEFSDDKEESHNCLFDKINSKEEIHINYDIPVYGRFYSMLYANSRFPQLIIYGNSSSYSLSDLDYHQDKYEKLIKAMCFHLAWDVIFLP